MADPITLRVLTHEGLVVEEEAVSVMAPGEPGYLGILRNHAPLVTTLQAGKLSWRRSSGATRMLLVGEGLLEIAQNRCTLLTGTVTEPALRAPADVF